MSAKKKKKKQKNNYMNYFKKSMTYLISILGAAGTALQNYVAVVALLQDLAKLGQVTAKSWMMIFHGVAIAAGGFCSGVVNFFINADLLDSFFARFIDKPQPQLKGWQKFRYWFGSAVFIATGVLFGMTAFVFGSLGVIGALSVAAGIFVAAIMVIQELETWLESFDNVKAGEKKTLAAIFSEWKASLTKGKVLGIAIAVGNVIALSLLFTLGAVSFFTGAGLPMLPALIIGLTAAFTGGAFTEFYFYNRFLSEFCDKWQQKWRAFCDSPYSPLGFLTSAVNGLVNIALSYVGITMMATMLTAVGIVLPPVAIVVFAAVAATFAGAASFILAISFWANNSARLQKSVHSIMDFFSGADHQAGNAAKPANNGSALQIHKHISLREAFASAHSETKDTAPLLQTVEEDNQAPVFTPTLSYRPS